MRDLLWHVLQVREQEEVHSTVQKLQSVLVRSLQMDGSRWAAPRGTVLTPTGRDCPTSCKPILPTCLLPPTTLQYAAIVVRVGCLCECVPVAEVELLAFCTVLFGF